MPVQYADRLAAHGFTAFTFDLSGFGKSGGAPRQTEMPSRKIDESHWSIGKYESGSLGCGAGRAPCDPKCRDKT
jgi:fermentation-respiration switch protein FrsA (DUF1100 family)